MPFGSPSWSDLRSDLWHERRWAVVGWAAIGARVIVAAILVFGPWTDEAIELDGWDVSRFQEIADAPGTPYIDHEVEYPPLTVVVAEIVLADDVVVSHRRLVVLSLLMDLGVAAVLARLWPRPVVTTYLLLGLVMLPSGLLRLDLWAALAAVIAAAALAPGRRDVAARPASTARDAAFAAATVVGALVKLWPALLVAAALGLGRQRAASIAIALGLAAGAFWLAVSGPAALEQMTSLRGVTGWHVESIPGNLTSLLTDEAARLEADAFRIGDISDTHVLIGRLATLAVVVVAILLARRSSLADDHRTALVTVAGVAALIVTAPLVSPQFLLWLTPWAAILHRDRLILGLTAAVISVTAATLGLFGPPELDHPVAAAFLLVRNAGLVALAVISLHRLRTPPWYSYARTGG